MKTTECSREQDVLDALAAGRWPERCDRELGAHVAACAICADVVDVARALQDAHDCAWQDARVPPSGRVWWRAEMRARQEAARRAAQPITAVHALAGTCTAGLALALVSVLWPTVWQSLTLMGTVTNLLGATRVELASLSAAVPPAIMLSLAVALGAGLVLTPLALYFVFSEK